MCTKVWNSQPAPISANVINQMLYLEIPGNTEQYYRHVDNRGATGLGTVTQVLVPIAADIL